VVIATNVVPLDSYQLLPNGTRQYGGYRQTVQAPLVPSLDIDARLVGFARSVGSGTALPPWPGSSAIPTIYEGSVGSTDVWTQNVDTLRLIQSARNTLCEEMEAAHIAWVCRAFGVPFLAIKDISNNELGTHTTEDGGTGLGLPLEEIGFRAAMITAAVVSSWSAF